MEINEMKYIVIVSNFVIVEHKATHYRKHDEISPAIAAGNEMHEA